MVPLQCNQAREQSFSTSRIKIVQIRLRLLVIAMATAYYAFYKISFSPYIIANREAIHVDGTFQAFFSPFLKRINDIS